MSKMTDTLSTDILSVMSPIRSAINLAAESTACVVIYYDIDIVIFSAIALNIDSAIALNIELAF